MTGWTWQAWFGLIGGTAIFFAVLVPMLLVQVRRYGGFSFRRLLGAAAVSVYAVALVAYTLLPLPEARANCAGGVTAAEWIPGHSIGDILRETEGLSLAATLTSRATLQVVLNVVLFVPFGMIARRYWNRGPVVSILLGGALSVLIEATQFTGVWGLYDCAYRVADVDDVIANTAGTAIGVLLAPLLLSWMPSARSLRELRSTPRPVTVWRRWFGMILDAIVVNVAISVISCRPAERGRGDRDRSGGRGARRRDSGADVGGRLDRSTPRLADARLAGRARIHAPAVVSRLDRGSPLHAGNGGSAVARGRDRYDADDRGSGRHRQLADRVHRRRVGAVQS